MSQLSILRTLICCLGILVFPSLMAKSSSFVKIEHIPAPGMKSDSNTNPLVIMFPGGGCLNKQCDVGPYHYPFWSLIKNKFLQEGFDIGLVELNNPPSVKRYAAEASKQIQELHNKNPEKELVLFGHSEGTWVSLLVAQSLIASKIDVSRIVLTGVFAYDLQKTMDRQIQEIYAPLEKFKADSAELKKYLKSFHMKLEYFDVKDNELTPESIQRTKEIFAKQVEEFLEHNPYKKSFGDVPSVLDIVSKVSEVIPIHIVQGEADKETPVDQTKAIEALKRSNITVNILADHNHYLVDLGERAEMRPKRFQPLSDRAVHAILEAFSSGASSH